jgi:hypothetical protein
MARAPAIETHLICRRRSRATRAFRLAFSSLLLGTNDGRLAHLWAAASFPMKATADRGERRALCS